MSSKHVGLALELCINRDLDMASAFVYTSHLEMACGHHNGPYTRGQRLSRRVRPFLLRSLPNLGNTDPLHIQSSWARILHFRLGFLSFSVQSVPSLKVVNTCSFDPSGRVLPFRTTVKFTSSFKTNGLPCACSQENPLASHHYSTVETCRGSE